MGMKQNCWEFKKCGRQPMGTRVSELGVCPAASDASSNETNGGKNGGRICWAVTGTFCGGEVQGTFAQKQLSCMTCDFFKLVKEEESKQFKILRPGQAYQQAHR